MSIRVEPKIIVYESVTMTAIDPEHLGFKEDEIRRYMKENPMPDDPSYSSNDLVIDLTESAGILTLPDGVTPETMDYVAELIQALI